MRINTDAPRNVDVCIVYRMFLVQSHVVLPSTLGGEANVTQFVLSDVQIVSILHVTLINVLQLMILPENIIVW